jgi:HlyD family secretion protein
MEEKPLFRKTALKEFNKQNNLGDSIRIITARSWIYLIIIIIVLFASITWLFLGTITSQVYGQGILFAKDAKIIPVTSPQPGGYVEKMNVRAGQKIKKGDVVAILINPRLVKEIRELRQYVTTENEKLSSLKKRSLKEISKRIKSIDREKNTINTGLKILEEKKAHLDDLLKTQKISFKKGIVSKLLLSETQVAFFDVKDEINKYKKEEIRLEQNKADYIESWDVKLRMMNKNIRQSSYQLKNLLSKHNLSNKVISPATGVVFSNYVKKGDFLQKKTTLTDIVTYTNELEAVAFVHAKDGKKIKNGMKAKVFPNHIKAIEYGGLVGHVYFVSELPMSYKSIENLFENKRLIDTFLKKGPVVEVRIKLIKTNTTRSGYVWTTSNGPNEILSIGSLAKIGIVVKSRAPISIIIPVMKNTKNWILTNDD